MLARPLIGSFAQRALTRRPLASYPNYVVETLLYTLGGAYFLPADAATLFETHDGSTPSTPGNPVGRVEDRGPGGYNALQAVSAARPTLGQVPANGRNNQFSSTEATTGWINTDTSITLVTGVTGLDDGFRITKTGSSPAANTRLPFATTIGADHTVDIWVRKVSGGSDPTFLVFKGDHKDTTWSIVEGPGSLSVDGLFRATLIGASTSEWTHLQGIVDGVNLTDDETNLFIYPAINEEAAGIGKEADVWHPNAVLGTSRLTYQYVDPMGYIVTETGKRSLYYLSHDDIDDALSVTLPNWGSDCVRAIADENGVTINEGVTLNGATELTKSDKLFAELFLAGPVTAAEKAAIESALSYYAGSYA